jgi:hypothetical protein
MTKAVKIGIGVGILGAGVGTYFLIQYLRLKKRYNTTLSPADASIVIKQQAEKSTGQIIPDDITKNADLNKGTETEDSTDAAPVYDKQPEAAPEDTTDYLSDFDLYGSW